VKFIQLDRILICNTPHGATDPSGLRLPPYRVFIITLNATPQTVGLLWTRDRTDAETTHNTHNRQAYMFPAGFEPVIPPSERLETHTLDHLATEIIFVYNDFAKYIMDKNEVKNYTK
jgi:hypothetical protein